MDKMCVLSLLRGSKKIESLVTNYYTSNYSILCFRRIHLIVYLTSLLGIISKRYSLKPLNSIYKESRKSNQFSWENMLELSDFKVANVTVLHGIKVNTLDIHGSYQQKK